MAESEEKLKILLMKVEEEHEKAGLKLNIQKTKIMASGPIASWQIDREQWKQWKTIFGDSDTGHNTDMELVPNWERSTSRLYTVTLLI